MKEALLLPPCTLDFHHLPSSTTSVICARCSEVAIICSDWFFSPPTGCPPGPGQFPGRGAWLHLRSGPVIEQVSTFPSTLAATSIVKGTFSRSAFPMRRILHWLLQDSSCVSSVSAWRQESEMTHVKIRFAKNAKDKWC